MNNEKYGDAWWQTPEFPIGTIVRYSDGPTALARINSKHAGGYHADHCLGGGRFIHGHKLRRATPEDIAIARRSRSYVL